SAQRRETPITCPPWYGVWCNGMRECRRDRAAGPRPLRRLRARPRDRRAVARWRARAAPAAAGRGSRAARRARGRRPHARAGARPRGRRLAAAIVAVAVMALGFAGARWWYRPAADQTSTTIAVVRFDNETANPDFDRFADALTDTVVAQLTASGAGRYQVIGNAAILRGPRERRDLRAIASSLGVGYVVLGQVQLSGARIRVLAHLIRMPEQTHVWVTRLDR